jgi:hypothetical protein
VRETAPFAKFQLLPKSAQPITTWVNQDLAYEEIALEIRAIVTRNPSKDFGQFNLNTQNGTLKVHQPVEISDSGGKDRGKESAISPFVIDKLNTLHHYQKMTSELKRIHNMLHELESSLSGLNTTLQVPLFVNDNKGETNSKGWFFVRRDVVRKDIDRVSVNELVIQQFWQEV